MRVNVLSPVDTCWTRVSLAYCCCSCGNACVEEISGITYYSIRLVTVVCSLVLPDLSPICAGDDMFTWQAPIFAFVACKLRMRKSMNSIGCVGAGCLRGSKLLLFR